MSILLNKRSQGPISGPGAMWQWLAHIHIAAIEISVLENCLGESLLPWSKAEPKEGYQWCGFSSYAFFLIYFTVKVNPVSPTQASYEEYHGFLNLDYRQMNNTWLQYCPLTIIISLKTLISPCVTDIVLFLLLGCCLDTREMGSI